MKQTPIQKSSAEWLLAIDPSLTRTGFAIFHHKRLLLTATVPGGDTKDAVAARAKEIATDIHTRFMDTVKAAGGTLFLDGLAFVSEWPQIYTAVKSKGDPNGMFGMCAIASMLYMNLNPMVSVFYKPAQWCGQIPKGTTKKDALTSPRARRVLASLTDAERNNLDMKKLTHDELDAIGLGLYALDRFHPVKVFPGATP